MSEQTPKPSRFGANQWLVDELYEKFKADKNSVDPAWWDFFNDYTPSETPVSSSSAEPKVTFITAPPTTTIMPPPQQTAAGKSEVAVPQTVAPTPAPSAVRDLRPHVEIIPSTEPAEIVPLKGASARVVTNMESSLSIPTATSVRAIPAKLMVDNRTVINNHLARGRGGKVSFTHIIGFAVVQALRDIPEMNFGYTEVDGKPAVVQNKSVNLGLAIDMAKPDGTRQLLVPNIKNSEQMDFHTFWLTYEDVVRKARNNKLEVSDFQGTTISLTNPGTIGTVHSVPRLMEGQGLIVGVGALDYPAEFQGASEEVLANQGISKVITMTSTYDHRIIQGAMSGDFLARVHQYLLGENDFYGEIFRSLRIPYEPIRWARDIVQTHDSEVDKTTRVHALIHAYRVRGHLMADVDPLEYKQRNHQDLDVSSHGLTLWDLDREFAVDGFAGRTFMKLRGVLGVLRDAYCRTIGIEYMHLADPEQRKWVQERVERGYEKLDREEQLRILHKLNEAEAFETFLQTKYVGQKRFSLEGGESAIPLVDAILEEAADNDYAEVCIGMPHRGRLNMLANIAGKSYNQIFREFEGHYGEESVQGSGDVKYHLGTKGQFTALSGKSTNVYLAANPSHLEAVNPVLEGIVRAKQDQMAPETKYGVLPILMHGDAAFAGQGVVTETLNLSQLQGYRVGGTIHVVVNNQVGFTTSPRYSRSSTYATDVARMVQAPIFHVNGDDPEAVVKVARIAFEFRRQFHKDVVIDLVCYRRRGHNEADDPSLTQPLMYDLIDQKRSVRKLYTENLIGRGDISVEEAEAALKHFQDQLENVFQATKAETHDDDQLSKITHKVMTEGQVTLDPQTPAYDVNTGISIDVVNRVVQSQLTMPEGFTVHPRLAPQLKRRAEMVENNEIDWGMAEALAFGSLLTEGRTIRLAGQDSRRGTFGHRHAVIVDKVTGWQYKPLKQCYENGGKLYIYDSFLSEYAAMGFEYGYSVERPDALVLWEAQFGDFANGAQTIIDEYISSGEQKWGQRSSVTLLLPHGFEGQGPDHSSARIERFLQLCAQDNMTVAQPSTAASY
ncbi:MAG: hypothetical protein RJA41_949, partial [Actinomycetota bacterium]